MISVVVPYKNAAKWIRRCAESLKAQEGDFEFIFVDDFSPDESRSIVKGIADDRFRLAENYMGPGVSGARTTGIAEANGEWVTFLDADDEMLPHAYAAFTMAIDADPEADIHQFNHKRYYTALDRLVVKYANDEGRYTAKDLGDAKVWFGVWNKLIRRSFLIDNCIGFDTGLQYGEDGLFMLECIAKAGFVHNADRRLMTVKHRFDNKESLSHMKKPEDIVLQVDKYMQFMLRQKDPVMRLAVCDELVRLWGSKSIRRLFGGEI